MGRKKSFISVLKRKLTGGGGSGSSSRSKSSSAGGGSSSNHDYFDETAAVAAAAASNQEKEMMETELAHELAVAFNIYSKVRFSVFKGFIWMGVLRIRMLGISFYRISQFTIFELVFLHSTISR